MFGPVFNILYIGFIVGLAVLLFAPFRPLALETLPDQPTKWQRFRHFIWKWC